MECSASLPKSPPPARQSEAAKAKALRAGLPPSSPRRWLYEPEAGRGRGNERLGNSIRPLAGLKLELFVEAGVVCLERGIMDLPEGYRKIPKIPFLHPIQNGFTRYSIIPTFSASGEWREAKRSPMRARCRGNSPLSPGRAKGL